jgi:hypothetical protein
MTRTGPGDVVMPACHRTVPARCGSRQLGSGWGGRRETAFAGTAVPRSASPKPAHPRSDRRSGRLRPVCPPWRQRAQTARRLHPPCPRQPALAHPLYLYLLGRHTTSICGWSFDPGRDILCIFTFTSPLRWLQWP